MTKVRVSASPEAYTKQYREFRGADFSTDSSLVAANRSPMPLNMIADIDGTVVKRHGWRIVKKYENGKVLNIFSCKLHGLRYWFVAVEVDKKVTCYVYNTQLTMLIASTSPQYKNSRKGKLAFYFVRDDEEYVLMQAGGINYIYGGAKEALQFKHMRDMVTPPLYMINIPFEDGSHQKGVPHEPLNIIGLNLRVRCIGNAERRTVQVPHFGGKILTIKEVRKLEASGKWGYVPTNKYEILSLNFGIIKFTEPQPTLIAGQDNIEIEYSINFNSKRVDIFDNCNISIEYGYNAHNRLFVSHTESSDVIYSAEDDPLYFPETNYLQVGSPSTKITGFLRSGSDLAILKDSENESAGVFMCQGRHEDGKTFFAVRQGVSHEGGIAPHSVGVLQDEPLFLSKLGIMGLNINLLNYERSVRNRSYFLNPKLTKEENLYNATSATYKGFYILCVNGNCYVLDGNKKTAIGDGEYSYDGYYFENVPAEQFCVADGLYFISGNKLCKFNDDIPNLTRYSDGGTLNEETGRVEGGMPIFAQWSTPAEDDVGLHKFKTLLKKGCLASLKPYDRSSAKVFFIKDRETQELITAGRFDIFDWEDIDFTNFSFDSSVVPREVYFNKKKKKYKRLQIIISNNELNEGFGLYQIIKTFTVNNYSKERD